MRRPTFRIQQYNNAAGVPAKLNNDSPYAALNANIVKLVNTHTRENLLDLHGSANLGQYTRDKTQLNKRKGQTQGTSLEFLFGCNFCPQTGSWVSHRGPRKRWLGEEWTRLLARLTLPQKNNRIVWAAGDLKGGISSRWPWIMACGGYESARVCGMRTGYSGHTLPPLPDNADVAGDYNRRARVLNSERSLLSSRKPR